MLSCVLIAGVLFVGDNDRLYNFHHAEYWYTSRNRLYAAFVKRTRSFDIPPLWRDLPTEALLHACAQSAEDQAGIAAHAASADPR